jgi:hypothetical protein
MLRKFKRNTVFLLIFSIFVFIPLEAEFLHTFNIQIMLK